MLGGVIKEVSYQVNFREEFHGKALKDLQGELYKVFDDVVDRGKGNAQEGDMGRLYINHPQLQKSIIIPPQPTEEINSDAIMEAIENMLQSEEGLAVTDGFEVQLGVARMERGGYAQTVINAAEAQISK